jgi:hypothetical protein
MDRRVGSNAELIQQGKNELFIRVVVNDPGRKRRELIAQRNTELAIASRWQGSRQTRFIGVRIPYLGCRLVSGAVNRVA